MIFLAKLGIGMLGATLVSGAAVSSEGFIHVKVEEKQAEGTHINLIVPAALVPVTLRFVPPKYLVEASENLRPYMPIIDTAIPAVEDSPDGVLVEVADGSDQVRITKRGGSIVVDVNDTDATVHVSVPLRAAQSSIHEIAAANRSD
ncbi:MAG: hypothetical protein JO159_04580 [Acidobacteria bacterium]|nr:hypothetical protein [Acidobacteriota bacterium]